MEVDYYFLKEVFVVLIKFCYVDNSELGKQANEFFNGIFGWVVVD